MFARAAISRIAVAGARAASTKAASTAGASSARAAFLVGGAAAASLGLYMTSTPSSARLIHNDGPRTIAGEYKTDSERSYVMIKPDGTSRQIVGKIIDRFESRGYKIVAIKSLVPSKALAEQHYADLSSKPFFPSLVEYITQGVPVVPVVAIVFEGKDVIRQGRRIVGATNPLEADPGSIRGQYAVSIGRNIIHASDSFDSATKEIGLWFNESELASYKTAAWDQIFADN